MTRIVRGTWAVAVCAAVIVMCIGCSPAGIAIHVVGVAVDSVEAKSLGDELIGQPVAAANTKLGSPVDTWREVGGSRAWWTYPVGLDVRGNQRYVVEESRGRIASVSKVKIDDGGIDIARKLALDQKVKGKLPQECEAALGMGRPLVTARSDVTGMYCQLYDAKMIKEVGSSQYCRVRFDANQRCDEVAIVNVAAAAGGAPGQ
jgi:hypothetical protein